MRSSVDDLPDDSFPMTMMRGSTISSPIFFMPALVSLRISAIFLITWPYSELLQQWHGQRGRVGHAVVSFLPLQAGLLLDYPVRDV